MTRLWGVRCANGETFVRSSREACEATVVKWEKYEKTGVRLGGPWEVVTAEIEWEPAELTLTAPVRGVPRKAQG